MELTSDQLDGWKHHPVTQYILNSIAESVVEMRRVPRCRDGQSMEQIALKCAQAEGLIEGALQIQLWLDNLEFQKKQSEEGNG